MQNYVKFQLEDGTEVYIESGETPKGSSGLIPSKGVSGLADQSGHSFEKAFESIRKMAGTMVAELHTGFSEPPSEVSVSFGLKASGELGNLVVARTGIDVNYNISVRWSKESKKEDSADKKSEEKKP